MLLTQRGYKMFLSNVTSKIQDCEVGTRELLVWEDNGPIAKGLLLAPRQYLMLSVPRKPPACCPSPQGERGLHCLGGSLRLRFQKELAEGVCSDASCGS